MIIPMPAPAPLDTDAICRWCHEPLLLTDDGQFVGIDRHASCNANTAGCGPICGFFCGCDGLGWLYGGHEPLEVTA